MQPKQSMSFLFFNKIKDAVDLYKFRDNKKAKKTMYADICIYTLEWIVGYRKRSMSKYLEFIYE